MLFVHSDLSADDLKGIGYSYRVYTFATHAQLNGLWYRGHEQKDALLEPTMKRFPIELRDRLRTVRQLQEIADETNASES